MTPKQQNQLKNDAEVLNRPNPQRKFRGKPKGPPSGFGRGRGQAQRAGHKPRPVARKPRKQPKRAKPKQGKREGGGAIPQPLAFEYSHFDPKNVFRGPGTTKGTWIDSFVADGEITVVPFAGSDTQTAHYHTLRSQPQHTTVAGVNTFSTASYNPSIVMASSQNTIAFVAQPHVMVANRFLQPDSGRYFGIKDNSVTYLKEGSNRSPFEYHLTSGYICDPTYDGSYGIYTPLEPTIPGRDPALVTKYAPTIPLRTLNKPFPSYLTDVDHAVVEQGGKYRTPCAFRFTGAKMTITVTQNMYNAEGTVYGGCCRSKQYEKPEIFADDHNMIDSVMMTARNLDVPIFDSTSQNNASSIDLTRIGKFAADKTYEATWICNNDTATAWHGSFGPIIAHDTMLLSDSDVPAGTGGPNVGDGIGPLSIIAFPNNRTRGTITSSPNVPTLQLVISGIPATGCKLSYGITYGVELIYMAQSTAANMMLNAKLANDYIVRMNKYGICKSAGFLGEVLGSAINRNPALAKVRAACATGHPRLSPPLDSQNQSDFGRGAA